jgi:peptide deformylase
VGLAAPQIDKPYQALVINVPETEGLDIKPLPRTIIFNPKIEVKSSKKIRLWEGCLSVPNLRGVVNRHDVVTITFKNENAEIKKIQATGISSIKEPIQHQRLTGCCYSARS